LFASIYVYGCSGQIVHGFGGFFESFFRNGSNPDPRVRSFDPKELFEELLGHIYTILVTPI
tara:strand:- start:71 stop:253 length:183 start_codon:yes stop_codon:yes gene_type:complete